MCLNEGTLKFLIIASMAYYIIKIEGNLTENIIAKY